jgi:RNA polymerase sigma-70 factor, ECF subfamily
MTSPAIPADLLDWDDKLIERAIAGELRAFERLYRQHVGRVYALCLRLTRSVTAAEDCTQQTFIRAWSSLRQFETRSSFGTWLHRIAVNVVFDQRRKGALKMASLSGPMHEHAVGHCVDTPVELREIESAILSLPEGARDVLVLSTLCGHSHAEVAQMLGIAEGTCKAQLHRARQLLRSRLGMGDE